MTTIAIAESIEQFRERFLNITREVGRRIVGHDEVVSFTVTSLLAGGHVLLEGIPGVGKTSLVHTLADVLHLTFSRIQFTPDLMPADIVGTNIIVEEGGERRFRFQQGPIFSNLVLADEINRATPKTQSALLEAMQEHAVTIAGKRHALEEPFFVLATENPIEMEGTYPLPEAQLDRFLLKVLVPTPDEQDMTQILERTTGQPQASPASVLSREEVLSLRALCRDVAVAEPVLRYAARLVGASGPESKAAPELVRRAVRYGAGVRGAQALVLAAKACALLEGRAQVAFADIQRVALPALRHRLIRSFEGEADAITTDQVVNDLIERVPTRPEPIEQALKGS